MASPLSQFSFPVRSADVWGLNEEERRPQEDIAADLDFQDNAVEDYLNNTVPNIYISQASVGSGTIDPTQMASGTAGAGKAPVGSPPVWTDIATQAELDAHTGLTGVFHGTQHGSVVWTFGGLNTNTSTTVIFTSAFSGTPTVALGLLNPGGLNVAAELTGLTSAQFTVRVFATGGSAVGTTSGSVHWFGST